MLDTINKNSLIHLEKGDIIMMDIEAIVFYAQHDLVLGSGFGNSIAVRGGPSIQEELKAFGTLATGDAVITSAGKLKSNYIIHAVGPRFQESNLEGKLILTIQNALKVAEENNIHSIGFPPMGTGFYGVPLDLSARVMHKVISDHLGGNTMLKKVVISVIDKREFNVFKKELETN